MGFWDNYNKCVVCGKTGGRHMHSDQWQLILQAQIAGAYLKVQEGGAECVHDKCYQTLRKYLQVKAVMNGMKRSNEK